MTDVRRRVLCDGRGGNSSASHVADAFIARGDEVWIVDGPLPPEAGEYFPPAANIQGAGHCRAGAGRVSQEAGGFDVWVSHHAAQIDVAGSRVDGAAVLMPASMSWVCSTSWSAAASMEPSAVGVRSSSGGVRLRGAGLLIPTPGPFQSSPLPYGVTKLTGSTYLNYLPGPSTAWSTWRAGTPTFYGPGRIPTGRPVFVAIFSTRLLPGEGSTSSERGADRDYVYVGDVVAANLLAFPRW